MVVEGLDGWPQWDGRSSLVVWFLGSLVLCPAVMACASTQPHNEAVLTPKPATPSAPPRRQAGSSKQAVSWPPPKPSKASQDRERNTAARLTPANQQSLLLLYRSAAASKPAHPTANSLLDRIRIRLPSHSSLPTVAPAPSSCRLACGTLWALDANQTSGTRRRRRRRRKATPARRRRAAPTRSPRSPATPAPPRLRSP